MQDQAAVELSFAELMTLIDASGQTAALQQVISDLQQLQQTADQVSDITGTITTATTTTILYIPWNEVSVVGPFC